MKISVTLTPDEMKSTANASMLQHVADYFAVTHSLLKPLEIYRAAMREGNDRLRENVNKETQSRIDAAVQAHQAGVARALEAFDKL